jgi:hypothetical protein
MGQLHTIKKLCPDPAPVPIIPYKYFFSFSNYNIGTPGHAHMRCMRARAHVQSKKRKSRFSQGGFPLVDQFDKRLKKFRAKHGTPSGQVFLGLVKMAKKPGKMRVTGGTGGQRQATAKDQAE